MFDNEAENCSGSFISHPYRLACRSPWKTHHLKPVYAAVWAHLNLFALDYVDGAAFKTAHILVTDCMSRGISADRGVDFKHTGV